MVFSNNLLDDVLNRKVRNQVRPGRGPTVIRVAYPQEIVAIVDPEFLLRCTVPLKPLSARNKEIVRNDKTDAPAPTSMEITHRLHDGATIVDLKGGNAWTSNRCIDVDHRKVCIGKGRGDGIEVAGQLVVQGQYSLEVACLKVLKIRPDIRNLIVKLSYQQTYAARVGTSLKR